MTPVALDGFLSKKQIEASYGRSYRSLTRDITRAVKTGNTDVLRHLKLITEDDKVREGTEVTLELIQDLSNHGMRPTWLAEESWVAEWCARRRLGPRQADAHEEPSDDPGPSPSKLPPTPEPGTATPPTSSVSVEMFQQRIDDQKQQIELLRGQLQIKDDQIRTANQLAEQSQQLMRDLHVLLKNVQDGLLGEGTRPLIAARTSDVGKSLPATDDRPGTSGSHEDSERRSTPVSSPAAESRPASNDTSTTAQSNATKRSRRGTRADPSRTAPTKRPRRKPPAERARDPKPATNRHEKRSVDLVVKHLPTFRRAVRSFFRK